MAQQERPQAVILVVTPEEAEIIRVALTFTAKKTSMPAVKMAAMDVLNTISKQIIKEGGVYEG